MCLFSYRLLLLSCLLLGACAPSPLTPYKKNSELNFRKAQGIGFVHQIVEKNAGNGTVLHVYIEGDGRPWWRRSEVAENPTPRKLPILALMQMDRNAALYIGRPCYFSLPDPACSPIWWTHARYSQQIVASMNHVLDEYSRKYKVIRLIGHSGGGALAMLMARQREDINTVVTLAGNLDIATWTSHHNYSPLEGSLNPVEFPLPASIRQWHLVGSKDDTVPATLIRESVVKTGAGKLTVIDGIDHSCCWSQHWPQILEQLEKMGE